MSAPKIKSHDAMELSGITKSRCTFTNVPVVLQNAFTETALQNGFDKREAGIVAMMLFVRKFKGKVPMFDGRGALKARVNAVMEMLG